MTIRTESPIDFSNPRFRKKYTEQPIDLHTIYPVKYLPNFSINLLYSTTKDPELEKLLSTIKTDPFVILEPCEHKTDEFFRFSLINQDYCLIISVNSESTPFYLYNFIRSIDVVLFPNQRMRGIFEKFFLYSFSHFQYYTESFIVRSLIKYLAERPKIGEFFSPIINHDPKKRNTLYEAISQGMNGVFAYYVKRHDFFQFKIKMNHLADFSKNYKILNTICACSNYKLEVVFHSICNMLFIYKHFIGENNINYAYQEKRYVDKQIFQSIIQIVGAFKLDTDFVLVYEYKPLYKLTDNNFSSKTVDKCLLNLLKTLDVIHSREYVVKTITIDTVLFSVDNSIFFCNYHQFTKASTGFESDLYDFGLFIKKTKCQNKYLNELTKCNWPDFQSNKENFEPCFPVTQYFIYRTQKQDKDFTEFKFKDTRRDNQFLFDPRRQNSIGVLKTLIFCYASSKDITEYLDKLPSAKDNPDIYLSIGEEMLEFNEKKGIQILDRVIVSYSSSSSVIKDKAYYIIGKYYFFKKNYMKMQDYFTKISNDAKIFYIIGRMYQKNLFSYSVEKSINSTIYFQESLKNEYWRTFYRKGLDEMEKNNFQSAIGFFEKADNNAIKDLEGDKELFNILGDNCDYLKGMIMFNMAICYKKIEDYDMMKIYFKYAVERECELAYAQLSYVYLIDTEYDKSFELLLKSSDFLPLNFKLIVEINTRLIHIMIEADRIEKARKFLNLAIKLNANSQNCDESSKNFLIKNIQKYSLIIANLFYSRCRFSDAIPCYALSAAFGHHTGFIGLAKIYLTDINTQSRYLNALICIKSFIELYDSNDNDDQIINVIDEMISKYPIYMQRECYFEIGSLLFYSSRSPYIPFDFFIKASSLTLPDVTLKDIKFTNQKEEKIQIVLNSILNHYQYLIQNTTN